MPRQAAATGNSLSIILKKSSDLLLYQEDGKKSADHGYPRNLAGDASARG
ncbi:hypothetical protein ACFSC1_15100 [Paracoccus aurantiacus]|nr:hypothetical protein [Paracoccus aurantiacus]